MNKIRHIVIKYMKNWYSKETAVVDILLDLISNMSYSANRGLPISPIIQLLTA